MNNLTTEVSNLTGTNLEATNLEITNLEEINLEEAIAAKVRKLPRERQQQILDFAEFLNTKISVDTAEKNPEPKLVSQSLTKATAVSQSVPEINPPTAIRVEGGDTTTADSANTAEVLEAAMSQSFLELAQKYVGCVEAPKDPSTNKKYFVGFGE